jgi:tetratricopeptide (TPR) repeat protein
VPGAATAGDVTTPTPPAPPVLTAREQSLRQIRELLDKKDYEGALRESEILLTLDPQDENARTLKQEAAAGLATPPVTTPPVTTPAPPSPTTTITQQKTTSAPGSRGGRRGTSGTNVGTPSTQASPAQRPAESEAEALNKRIQAAIQEGQALESKGELPAALSAFERAKNLEPSPGEAHRLYDNLRTRMTREGEQLFRNAKEDAAVGKLIEAREGFTKAIAYLPDGHPTKQQARDALGKIK